MFNLLNDDFSGLVQLIRDDEKESGIYDVLNGKVSPPEGLTRIPCVVCGETMTGALVDTSNRLGKYIIQVCDEAAWKHGSCHEKIDDEDEE